MWEAFKNLVFDLLNFFYSVAGDWGMAILIVTLILRVIISPLTHASTKSSYQMQKIQPKLQELQAKYADDQPRLQEEMQKLYAEAKFNPLTGCLPLFLQMPIFIALFQVLNEMSARLGDVNYSFYHLVPNLITSPSVALSEGFGPFIPYAILLVVFAGATFAPMVLMQLNQKNSSQRTQMLVMSAFMTVFMLWIGWSSPAGVLLYWGLSSLIGVAQQQVSMKIMKDRDARLEAEKEDEPVAIEVIRKEKKKRPTKKR